MSELGTMLAQIMKILLTIVLLFLAYQLLLKATGQATKAVYAPPPKVEERFKPMIVAEPVPVFAETPKPVPEERPIVPAGPNPPSQRAPSNERHIMETEQPMDPFAENQEDAYAGEKLRHPERMFRPPPENNNTALAVQGGLASQASAAPAQMSSFAPEMAQNGGFFMDGVMANDTFEDSSIAMY
jgi:hypothetical protein